MEQYLLCRDNSKMRYFLLNTNDVDTFFKEVASLQGTDLTKFSNYENARILRSAQIVHLSIMLDGTFKPINITGFNIDPLGDWYGLFYSPSYDEHDLET